MTRSLKAHEIERRAKAKRAGALARNELRQPSVPRVSAAGVTSAPVKAQDESIRAMIDEALAQRIDSRRA